MKVYVVMGNDFPDKVFATEEAAEAYCIEKKSNPENRVLGISRIYWRVYEFEVQS